MLLCFAPELWFAYCEYARKPEPEIIVPDFLVSWLIIETKYPVGFIYDRRARRGVYSFLTVGFLLFC